MLSSHPTSVRCDNKKRFITCFATLTAACSFVVVVWVHSFVSSPFPYTYMCLCVFIKKKKKKTLSVAKSSHNGNVWYWKGVYHLIRDTNCCMQFWCCLVSVFSCSIPFPLIICLCVCLTKKKRKERHSVLSCRPKSVMCDIEIGFITCYATLSAVCGFVVGVWVYSLASSPFPNICVCV